MRRVTVVIMIIVMTVSVVVEGFTHDEDFKLKNIIKVGVKFSTKLAAK